MQPNADARKGASVRISEIYQSIQGEGLLTGTPSIFVRTSGCNLRCWFCDTPFASWRPEGPQRSIDEILDAIRAFSATHVVLTGGEPLIYRHIQRLCSGIQELGLHLTIETAATVASDARCDLMSISPKLSGSAPPPSSGSWRLHHERRRENLPAVRALMEQPYQLKFVVDAPADAEEVLEYLERLSDGGRFAIDRERVLLMPQGTEPRSLDHQAEWLLPWCEAHDVRFCPRAHIHWFGNQRGT